jgi:hypothetical protein
MVTGYGLEDRGSFSGRGKIFLYSVASKPVLGPPIQLVPGAVSPGVKPNRSPQFIGEIKNGGVMPLLPLTSHGAVFN